MRIHYTKVDHRVAETTLTENHILTLTMIPRRESMNMTFTSMFQIKSRWLYTLCLSTYYRRARMELNVLTRLTG